jgi:hypothetical protein
VAYEEYITDNDDMSRFHLDANLKAALVSLGCSGKVIEDACGKVGLMLFRVLGIKLEGMTEMGFLDCKKLWRNSGLSQGIVATMSMRTPVIIGM